MLFINDYNIINESKCSDKFEQKCARYLKRQFPNHKFTVKGGHDRTVSDILVDDSFYIECKMTERQNKHINAQSTGFGIKLVESDSNKAFECSETAENNDAALEILNYINSNINEFSKLIAQHSSKVQININPKVFARWISNYYKQRNVLFFITTLNNKFSIFKNTPGNLLKYFEIRAYARYFPNGSKDLPLCFRDNVLAALKQQLDYVSAKTVGKQLIIKTKDSIQNPYINIGDLIVYLSDKNQKPNEYRVMKISKVGSPRVAFHLYTISDQDDHDLNQFRNYLDKINV